MLAKTWPTHARVDAVKLVSCRHLSVEVEYACRFVHGAIPQAGPPVRPCGLPLRATTTPSATHSSQAELCLGLCRRNRCWAGLWGLSAGTRGDRRPLHGGPNTPVESSQEATVSFLFGELAPAEGGPTVSSFGGDVVVVITGRTLSHRNARWRPVLQTPALKAAADELVRDESAHIQTHEPLNERLLGQVFPNYNSLRRLHTQMFRRFQKLSPRQALAVCAAYEFASDSIFSAYFSRFYAGTRRHHPDPHIHNALIDSGVAPLFMWHALEELSHRHVAHDIAMAVGLSQTELGLGMVRVVSELVYLQFPALLELVSREQHTNLLRFMWAVFVEPGVVSSFAIRLLRWFDPRIDPGRLAAKFLPELAKDVSNFQRTHANGQHQAPRAAPSVALRPRMFNRLQQTFKQTRQRVRRARRHLKNFVADLGFQKSVTPT